MRWICASLAAALTLLSAGAVFAAAPVPAGVAEQAAREGRARVIVRLDAPAKRGQETASARAARRAAIAHAAERALAAIGGPARPDLRRYETLPLLALEASPRELAELAASDVVLAIEEDRPQLADLAAERDRASAPTVSTAAGLGRRGHGVVIVDTGVESSHPFFGGRVVAAGVLLVRPRLPERAEDPVRRPAPASPAPTARSAATAPTWRGSRRARTPRARASRPARSLIAIQAGSRTARRAAVPAARASRSTTPTRSLRSTTSPTRWRAASRSPR